MIRPTFNEQKEKIIQAYFKDEIKPYHSNFCFCGTLAPDEYRTISGGRKYKNWNETKTSYRSEAHNYTAKEYAKMETALLIELDAKGIDDFYLDEFNKIKEDAPDYEDRLFAGMVAALEVLKQIHIESGEVIDETPVFEKRKLSVIQPQQQ